MINMMIRKTILWKLEQVFEHFPKYHMKIIFREFNEKVGRENIFKPTVGNGSLYRDRKDNVVGIVYIVTSKNLIVKSTMFSHQNIQNYTWTFPAGKTHSQIDHILIDRRRHSNILDVRSFGAANCDSDLYLVVAKGREKFAASKKTTQNFYVERFNLRRLSELEVTQQYQIKISNRYAALENLNASKDISRV